MRKEALDFPHPLSSEGMREAFSRVLVNEMIKQLLMGNTEESVRKAARAVNIDECIFMSVRRRNNRPFVQGGSS